MEGHLTDGLGPLERGEDPVGQQLFGQRKHFGEGMRRFDFPDTEGGQHPPAVLEAQKAQPERLLLGRAGNDDSLPDRALGEPKLM